VKLVKSAKFLSLAFLSLVKPLDSKSFDLSMMVETQIEGPCISSLLGPAQTGCRSWVATVNSAFASWEKSRRLIFAGSGDNFLHVVDENGRPLYQLATSGRVVTDSVFNEDRTVFYIGTDKGLVYGIDSFTFKPLFSFTADSEINNNFIVLPELIFTSALGTIYCLDSKNGEVKWHIEQPLTVDRLRLASRSNILAYEEKSKAHVLVPDAEGYISVVNIKDGMIVRKISLDVDKVSGFVDIAAPMVWFKNHLWVASFGLGIFAIDVGAGKVRHSILEKGVIELASNDEKLFAASADALYAISSSGGILWKNPVHEVKSRVPQAAFPFDKFTKGAKRIFYGSPTKIFLEDNKLVTAYSLGSIGVFDQKSGHLNQILGNSVGFASLNKTDTEVLLVSKRGLLMKLHVPEVNP
jgi:outer membrane protein assembly factor BamB